jgi:hypothetical protein
MAYIKRLGSRSLPTKLFIAHLRQLQDRARIRQDVEAQVNELLAHPDDRGESIE